MVDGIIRKGDDISHLPAVKWGVAHESDGLKAFLSTIGPRHEGGLKKLRNIENAQITIFRIPDICDIVIWAC